MLIVLHQMAVSGNVPIYIVADDIQALHYRDDDGIPCTLMTMIHGNLIRVIETPLQVLEKLQLISPERWESTGDT